MTIHTILGCCEQCGSWTNVHILVVQDSDSEEIARCYCGECLGKKGFVPDSPLFIEVQAPEGAFRPEEYSVPGERTPGYIPGEGPGCRDGGPPLR